MPLKPRASQTDDQSDDVIKKANKPCHSPESHGELFAFDQLEWQSGRSSFAPAPAGPDQKQCEELMGRLPPVHRSMQSPATHCVSMNSVSDAFRCVEH